MPGKVILHRLGHAVGREVAWQDALGVLHELHQPAQPVLGIGHQLRRHGFAPVHQLVPSPAGTHHRPGLVAGPGVAIAPVVLGPGVGRAVAVVIPAVPDVRRCTRSKDAEFLLVPLLRVVQEIDHVPQLDAVRLRVQAKDQRVLIAGIGHAVPCTDLLGAVRVDIGKRDHPRAVGQRIVAIADHRAITHQRAKRLLTVEGQSVLHGVTVLPVVQVGQLVDAVILKRQIRVGVVVQQNVHFRQLVVVRR
ncbi:hypothetical protein D3C76_947190 [compost metagenome]